MLEVILDWKKMLVVLFNSLHKRWGLHLMGHGFITRVDFGILGTPLLAYGRSLKEVNSGNRVIRINPTNIFLVWIRKENGVQMASTLKSGVREV